MKKSVMKEYYSKASLDHILEKLSCDPVRNCNIAGFIENNEILEVNEYGDSVMVQGVSDRLWTYFSSTSEDELRFLVSNLKDEVYNFAVLEDWMLPVVKEGFLIEIELTTIKFILPLDVSVPEPSVNIFPLSPDLADYMYENYLYRKYTTAEYLKERIIKGPGGGIFVNDTLAAWILTQDDSAIGILQVLEKYRRKGFARELTNFMIHQVRNKGRIPFAHIEESNTASLSLVRKAGFVVDRRVHWARGELL